MNNTKILEMISNNQIKELTKLLQDEIYKDSMKGNSNAKKRYEAMKKYIKIASSWTIPNNEKFHKPCKIEFEGTQYYSFCDSYSLVLTTESIGELEEYDNKNNDYLNVKQLIILDGEIETLNLNTIIAEAKAKGYKLNKDECTDKVSKYYFTYKDDVYKISLLDLSYNIINNSDNAEVYYKGKTKPLIIKNEIGIAMLMPVNKLPEREGITVIELKSNN